MWFPEWLYTIDILFVIFILLCVLRGMKHGLSGELAHVMMLTVLLVGFCFFYPQIMQFATEHWQALPSMAVRIGVAVLLSLCAVLLFFVMRLILRQVLKNRLGEVTDKLIGGLAGSLRGALVGVLVFVGLSLVPSEALYQTISEKSSVGAWVCQTLTPWAQSRVSDLPALKEKAEERLEEFTE